MIGNCTVILDCSWVGTIDWHKTYCFYVLCVKAIYQIIDALEQLWLCSMKTPAIFDNIGATTDRLPRWHHDKSRNGKIIWWKIASRWQVLQKIFKLYLLKARYCNMRYKFCFIRINSKTIGYSNNIALKLCPFFTLQYIKSLMLQNNSAVFHEDSSYLR